MFHSFKQNGINQAYKAQDEILDRWGDRSEIAGVGITKDDKGYAIQIHLTKNLPDNCSIPKIVNNIPVYTDIVGEIYAYELVAK